MLDLASILTQFRPLILWLLAAVLGLPWLTGCESGPKNDADWIATARNLRDLGFKGELTVIGGDGHLMGQSLNLSGVHWYGRIAIDPEQGLGADMVLGKPRKTDSQPSVFDAP